MRTPDVPVIPILTIEEVETAVPLARAISAGGLNVIEVTLRTAASIEAIRRIAGELEEVVVGAGTVRNANQVNEAVAAGARFLVSPGCTPALVDASLAAQVPFMPGIATVSEALLLAEQGFDVLKFFPAQAAGGVPALMSFAAPLPDLRFCPTGGITATNAAAYLALPNVVCVGGSWIAPLDAVKVRDWDQVTALARAASALRGAARFQTETN